MNHKVSPSQIAEARRCLRSWWWQSVKGYRKPDTAATAFGSEVHANIEDRILNGYWGDDTAARKCAVEAHNALSGTVRMPDTRQGDLVEADWSLPSTYYPLESRGRIDLVMPHENVIVDWKTTSSKAWIKTPETLASDPQVIMYTDALVGAGVVQLPVQFMHVYTLTKGGNEALIVRTKVDAQTLSIGRKGIVDTMQKMVDVLHMNDPYFEDVPANILACGDFGGCFHRERCFGQSVKLEGEENMGSFAEVLAARRAAQSGTPSQAPAACVPVAASGVNPPDAPVAQVVAQVEQPTPAKATKSKRGKSLPDMPQDDGVLYYTPKAGDSLLIGAMPLVWDGEAHGPDAWLLGDVWLAQFAQQAAETLKVAHWAIADYGKGKAAVTALVADACRRGDVPRYLILDRRNPLADAVCEVLIPHYRTVYAKMG